MAWPRPSCITSTSTCGAPPMSPILDARRGLTPLSAEDWTQLGESRDVRVGRNRFPDDVITAVIGTQDRTQIGSLFRAALMPL